MKNKLRMIFTILIACIILLIVTRSCFYSFPNQIWLRQTGKLVDKGKSGSYYYGFGFFKNNIYYWSNVATGDTPEKLEDADKETFKVLSKFYGIDKHRVYHLSMGITNVDVPTFELLTSDGEYERYQNYLSGRDKYYDFGRDKNHVYSLSHTSSEGRFAILSDANPATFQTLGNKWSKDDKSVYYNLEKVDADPQTFVNINGNYSKDKNYLYVEDVYGLPKEAIKEKCNTAELVPIPESGYIHTNTTIYYNYESDFMSLPLKDTTSIELLYDGRWLKVDGQVVFDGLLLDDPRVDGKTFVSLDKSFFRDKQNVYFWKWNPPGKKNRRGLDIVTGADLKTFESIGSYYAKDKNHVYYKTRILPDANPQDFRYDEKSGEGYSGNYVYYYGDKKDK